MSAPIEHGAPERGFLARNKWLILRRASQIGFLALFLAGPVAGVWIVKGTLASSLTLGVLPLTDPYILLQSLFAGNISAVTALIGALIVLAVYAPIGGRVYCSWVCPINIVTDASHWVSERLDIPKGWQPKRSLRSQTMAPVAAETKSVMPRTQERSDRFGCHPFGMSSRSETQCDASVTILMGQAQEQYTRPPISA